MYFQKQPEKLQYSPVIPKYLIVPNEYVFQRNSTDTYIKLKNLLILRLNIRSEK